MKRIAIIPARGGSKRIPRKNIRDFLGKPIIAYSIEAALKSSLFEEVMVSTDDEEIAAIARQYGARVPFMRSQKNADDFATTAEVLLEVLHTYESDDQTFDFACCVYPTAPLLQPGSLTQAYHLLTATPYDTVFPVLRFSYPIWRSLKLEHGSVHMNWPEHQQSRSQDLPPAYHDAGQFYWFRVAEFQQKRSLFTDKSGGLELSELEVQDIDNLTDWRLAELKYTLLAEGNLANE